MGKRKSKRIEVYKSHGRWYVRIRSTYNGKILFSSQASGYAQKKTALDLAKDTVTNPNYTVEIKDA